MPYCTQKYSSLLLSAQIPDVPPIPVKGTVRYRRTGFCKGCPVLDASGRLRRIKRGRGRKEKPREGKPSTNRWKGRGVYILEDGAF